MLYAGPYPYTAHTRMRPGEQTMNCILALAHTRAASRDLPLVKSGSTLLLKMLGIR